MAQRKKVNKKVTKPNTPKTRKSASSGVGSWFKAFLIALAILCVVRLFVYQTYVVHSSSMSSTLLPGDWILINKASYGARTPITLLSVPFAPIRYQTSSPRYFSDLLQLPWFRFPGFSRIKRNDIAAFNYPLEQGVPIDKKIMYVKRIVALPSDTVQIVDNKLMVNNDVVEIKNAQFEYRVDFKTRKIEPDLVKKYRLSEGSMLSNDGEYSLYLTDSKADSLKKEKSVSSVKKELPLYNKDTDQIFPFSGKLNWSLDNYGPIVVPKKGKSIPINGRTITLYRTVIERFEKNTISFNANQILINKLPVQSYFFKQNYYFVIDDNRDNPKDSRMWGFLPESHIVGKANFILFSFDPSELGVRWGRIFKKVE